jgi:cytochrome P450
MIGFARDPLGFCERLAEEYGDLAYFRVMSHDVVLVNHPDLAADFLKGKPEHLHKDVIYDLIRPLLGNGLVTSEDSLWRRNRALAAPSFARRHVDSYAATMAEAGAGYAQGLEHGEVREIHDDMMELTQDVALQTLFGGDLDLDLSGVGPAIDAAMEAFTFNAHGPGRLIPDVVPVPVRTRSARAIEALDQVIYSAMAARREQGLGNDLLSRLIAARDDEGGGLDDQQLRDEAVTIFLAGHETTAVSLTHTLLYLGTHPSVQDWVLEEIDASPEPLDAGAMSQFPRALAAIKEAMRIQPAVWVVGREAQVDLQIADTKIPAGTQVIVSQWVMHRDPRWFRDPLDYRPERWLDGSTDAIPKFAFMPFGVGPRVCIGNHFAMLESVLLLVAILRRARVRALAEVPVACIPSVTLRPTGPTPVRFELRARRP